MFIEPSDAVCTTEFPKSPDGLPPPNKTKTPLAGIIDPEGKVCLNWLASEIVYPDKSISKPEL